MGVIFRQSFKNSLVNYASVLVGVFSTIFIYPLDKGTYGLIQFLLSSAMLLAPFFLLGTNYLTTRFFPEFKDGENGDNGYWGVLSLIIAISFLIFSILFFFLESEIIWLYRDKSPLFKAYIPFILPLVLLISLLNFNSTFASNFNRIAVPAAFLNLIKVSLPVLIYLYFSKWINLDQVVGGVVLNYVVAVIAIVIYLRLINALHWKINWKFLNKERRNRMATYALYGMVAGVGSIVAFRIDAIMVPSLIDLKSNGIYSIAMFIGNAIAIPATAIVSISSPILSKSFTDGDFDNIASIYSKSSINLLIAGTLFFCLILPSVRDLFQIMPGSEEMTAGYWVVFFVGLAKVVEMMTSVNHQIIGHSNFYSLNLVMIAFLAVANVLLNIWLIPSYGLAGAAFATFASVSAYNLIKVGIIYWKLRLQPFSKQTILTLALGTTLFALFSAWPLAWHPVVNIMVRVLLTVVLFMPMMYYLRLSNDLNELIDQVVQKIRNRA